MDGNPALGIFFHWIGGLASASFYLPYRQVRGWNWENYWLVGGVFSWILAPWLFASLMTRDLGAVLSETPLPIIGWTYLFGVLWGLGGLTFGLTMRYLGISLGMSVALGLCAAFGTLIPPLFKGEFFSKILATSSGEVILFGVLVCLAGIGLAGMAGMTKESEMPEEEKRSIIKEFNFKKGMGIAVFSGIMSACFSFGLDAAAPMAEISKQHGTGEFWTGLPALIIVMAGGFTTNFIWCIILNIRNSSFKQYAGLSSKSSVPLAMDNLGLNYFFSAVAGVTWYFQFFFYNMGTSQMGPYGFSSWTLHMASIMIFSTIWGLILHEWRGSSRAVYRWLFSGLLTLVGSTLIIGYGAYMKTIINH